MARPSLVSATIGTTSSQTIGHHSVRGTVRAADGWNVEDIQWRSCGGDVRGSRVQGRQDDWMGVVRMEVEGGPGEAAETVIEGTQEADREAGNWARAPIGQGLDS